MSCSITLISRCLSNKFRETMNASIARKKRRKYKTIDMKWGSKKRLTHLFRCLRISSLSLLLGSNLQTSVLDFSVYGRKNGFSLRHILFYLLPRCKVAFRNEYFQEINLIYIDSISAVLRVRSGHTQLGKKRWLRSFPE